MVWGVTWRPKWNVQGEEPLLQSYRYWELYWSSFSESGEYEVVLRDEWGNNGLICMIILAPRDMI